MWLSLWKLSSGRMASQNVCVVIMDHHLHQNSFITFLEYLGIQHKKGVPYWPQSNEEVERCNETLLKIVRIAQLERRDWRKAVQDFLFQYRVTPHTVTGVSPAELLMGRRLRDKLPKVEFSDEQVTEGYWQQR